MLYKIVKITDKDGKDKLYSAEAMGRIGRIIDIGQSCIEAGSVGFLCCVIPSRDKSLRTSKITRVKKVEDLITFETMNSQYWLRKCEDES